MPEISEWQDGPVPCFDPECADALGRRSVAEPDGDNELRFYTCNECGSEFGHQRVPESVINTQDGSCSIGVPEAVRRQASAPMQRAIAAEAKSAPVPLQISFGAPSE